MGYLYVALASVLFGISPTLSALLLRNGWSNGAVLLNSEVLGALYLFLLIRWKQISLRISKREFLAAAGLSGLSFWGTNLLMQSSFTLLPSPGLTTVLHFIYPTFVMIMMVLFFKEKVTLLRLICIAISLCGIGLISNMSGAVQHDSALLKGMVMAIASGLAYAIYIISNDKSPAKGVHPLVLIFYVLVGGAVFNTFYLFAARDFSVSFAGRNLAYAVIVPLCSFSALVAIAEGIRRIGPTRAAVINMLEPVASMVVSALVFRDEPLTVRMICGGILILAGTGTIAVLNDTKPKERCRNPLKRIRR